MKQNKFISIAIDGPSGAGKSTLAKALSKHLGYIYVDTGALYRAIGLYMYKNNIDPKNAEIVTANLSDILLDIKYIDGSQHVFLNSADVSEEIRFPTISMYASDVSAIPSVRAFLLNMQREFSEKNNVIMDGRDIGTVVLPNAQIKLFIHTDIKTRAERRFEELKSKGVDVSFEDVYSDMKIRDENDSQRAVAPCVPADDAILYDNSPYTFEENVEKVIEIIEDKLNEII